MHSKNILRLLRILEFYRDPQLEIILYPEAKIKVLFGAMNMLVS